MKLLQATRSSLKLLLCLLLVLTGPASAHALTHRVLPLPALLVGYGWEMSEAVSPDGRWLAYFDVASPKRDVLVIYDLTRSKFWRRNVGRKDPESYGTGLLAWRQDSAACAVGVAGGWAIAWLGRHRLRWISHVTPEGECCAA